jgi:molecular chaperone GrpE
LAQQLDATARECAAAKDRYLRLFAEFENYKKRIQRDQIEYNKYATEKLLRELLPVADNLERAIAHARSANADSAIIDGLDLIARQFQDALQKAGIEPISAVGKTFDPALHQALAQVGSSEHEPDTVVEEAQRGYVLHGRILRPSLVTVAKQPAPGHGRGT